MNSLIKSWQRLWFKQDDGLQIEIVRFLIGCLLLINYVGLTPYIMDFYSADGWANLSAIEYEISTPWILSLHFWFTEPWQFLAFHSLFIIGCLFFTIGYHTRWIKWLVLIGHLSYLHRNPAIIYGVDNILASLLLLLCLAPIGKNFSFDAARRKYKEKLKDLNTPLYFELSPWGFACTRLMQLQMVTLYFFSAVDKLKGDTWWSGDALWIAVNNFEFNNIPVMWLAEHYWIANLMTYSTLIIEIAYAFLIWGKPTRPYFLMAALALHLGIAILMGLYLFAAVMAVGHLAFLRTEWILNFLRYWKKKFGEMEMFYDGECGFCKRSMAWILAFDGLNQIRAINFREKQLATVSCKEHEDAIYLSQISSDKNSNTDNTIKEKTLEFYEEKPTSGFKAYQHAVKHLPGLLWLYPLFNIPYISQKIGSIIYRYIATNRYAFSNHFFKS